MSSFKTQSRLLGLPVAGDSDDDDDDEHDREGVEDEGEGGEDEVEDSNDNDDDDEDDEDDKEGKSSSAILGSGAARARKQRSWLADNFITATKKANGTVIYKSELLPDKVFFAEDKVREFTQGSAISA